MEGNCRGRIHFLLHQHILKLSIFLAQIVPFLCSNSLCIRHTIKVTTYRRTLSILDLNHDPAKPPAVGADSSGPPTMSTWYSNILTTTTSRISNLQRTLLSSDADGDTEDDTHICRVLRNYYTEKGRPFPPWLPPDPKAPAPVAPVFAGSQGQVGSRYGAMQGSGAASQGGGNALSSLWDSGGANQGGQAAPASLRAGRTGGITGGSARNPFAVGGAQQGGGGGAAAAAQARPLASQRGSYESGGSYGRDGPSPPPGSSGGSAQERLRQKLWGGGSSRTGSPPVQQPQVQNRYGGGSSAAAGGGGGRTDDYEDRFAPGGMYDASSGSGGRAGGGDRPFMAANAPWASNEYDYSGGGNTGGGGRPAGGLPSGPRRGGLPSGPRMGR